MKKINLNNACLFLILLLGLGIQSCKKDYVANSEIADKLAKANVDALSASTGELFFGTVYKTPTIPLTACIATGSDGTMYVSSTPEDKVYKITTDSVVTVLAQNVNGPSGLKVAKNGNVYVALSFDNKIIRITPSGVVDTLRLNLTLSRPIDVAIADDLTLYITDAFHKRIVKVSPSGVATVLAGRIGSTGESADGTGAAANFNYPTRIKLGADGYLWVVDGDKSGGTGLTLRRVTTQGAVKTVIDATGTGVRINEIQPAKVDERLNTTTYGNVFVVYNRQRITQFNTQRNAEVPIFKNPSFGYVDGPVATAKTNGIDALSYRNNVLLIGGSDNAIRKIYKK
ncbi:hypothetical protein IDJ77_23325 [Mucilaginibacter sp. ZT4R22]|uniref:NHL repeat-containing protein n=1 Tax=Mucilaginibacter pankratovii TaxID=2772110 RepID=A0ABR7WWW1_9SPHI|nr:hypothetical protein [Mucilaginibacter pankratovii]MBD1366762.1 hypothetical protein [Mucilaginibacter pankratovii]